MDELFTEIFKDKNMTILYLASLVSSENSDDNQIKLKQISRVKE